MGGNGRGEWVPRGRGIGNPEPNPTPNPISNTNPKSNPKPTFVPKRNSHQNTRNPNRNFNANPNPSPTQVSWEERNGDQGHYQYRQVGSGSGIDGLMQSLQLSNNQANVSVNSARSQGTDIESAGDNDVYLNMNSSPSQDFRVERNGGHRYQYRPVSSSSNVSRLLQSSKLPDCQSNVSESPGSSERSNLHQTDDNSEENGPSFPQNQQRRPARGRGRGGHFDRNNNKNYYRRIGISNPRHNTASQGIHGQENDERIGDYVSDGQNEASILGNNFTNEDLIGPSIDGNQLTQPMGQKRRELKGFGNTKMMNSSQDWRCNLPPPQSYTPNQGILGQENAERIGDCDNDGRNKAYILGQNCTNEDHMTPFIHGNQLTQSTGQQRREMKGFRNRKMMGSSQDWRCNLLPPPPQNYESISAKQESREKTTLDRSSVPKLVQEIDEKLNKEKVECMICYEIVRRSAPIWSCGNCYAIFHLHCVRKWARAPSSVDLSAGQSQGSNWRCPGCQSVQLSFPDDLRYYCFCGKVQEPEVEFYLTPHSCGGPCGKPLEKEKKTKTPSCPHTCTLQCHPGPCPSCSAMAPPQPCPCGKTTITRRCSDHKSIESCGQCCEKPLRCGRHYCDKVCHEGLCGPCKVLIKASCFCGEKEEMILCGDMEIQGEIDWKNGVFACKNLCMKMLSCQNHKCSKICHPGECGECELSPGKVKSCPCGKTQLQNQRKSCMDSVPTCSEVCEKLLPCGKHLCINTCHQGECPPCLVSVNKKCRCGSSSQTVPCWKTMVSVEENDEFTCEKSCGQKKNCGRHRCSERCCPLANRGGSITLSGDWDPHLCQMSCGKKLQCGKHFCQELCHSGHCPPCLETIFSDLSCACGKTSIPPPVPCGTPIPPCLFPCSIPQPCGHLASHDCHFGECPPCTVPVAKECVGSHVVLKNVPCGSRDIRCNKLCGNTRQCGMHACTRTCHLPPCDSVSMENSSSVARISCGQLCGSPRRDCRHTCTASCHPSIPCPDTRCELLVTITCSCGRLTAKVPCDAGGLRSDPVLEASILHKLPAPLQPVQSNSNRVPLGQRKLACDDECTKLEKKKILADAFGICTTIDLPGVSEQISELLAELIRREPQWVSAVEERFRYLVLGKTKASSNSIRVHVFGPMPKDKRDMLRHLAERWSLFIYSAGRDPKRFLIIQATQKSRAPVRSIMPKGSLPTIGLVQPPPFNSVVDMDPRLVLALFDLPREAEVSSLILRFGGECELVWLNDKNALAIFTDPARAATALRRVDHASVYRGAIVVPHNGGLPNRNAWATKDGTAEKANAWKKNEQQTVWMEDSWGEDWSSAEVSKPVWQFKKNPIATTRNPYGALEKDNAGEACSSTSDVQPSSKPLTTMGSIEVSSSQENQNKYSPSEVDDWEKVFD